MRKFSGAVTLGLAVIALWLLAHPYDGIRHDGILYLGQAYSKLFPRQFAHDLFFAFGSQDSYTLFTPLYAKAVAWGGLEKTAIAFLILAQTAFLWTAFAVVRRLTPHPFVGFALVLLATAPIYGGLRIFSFGESFLTARSFAEPLVLASIAAVLANRRWLALLFLLPAFGMHPIIALPGLVIWWVEWSLSERRAWLLGVAGLIVLLLLAGLGVAPFADLLKMYDPEWLSVVEARNTHVLPLKWQLRDWTVLAFDACVLAEALSFCRGVRHRLLLAIWIAGVGGVVLAVIAADLAGNVLLTGLQLWRAHWLLHFAALALAPSLASRLWRSGPLGRMTASAYGIGFFFPAYIGGLLAVIFAAILNAWRRRGGELEDGLKQALPWIGAAALLAVFAQSLNIAQISNLLNEGGVDNGHLWQYALGQPAVALFIYAACYGIWRLPRWRAAAMVSTALLLGVAITAWDRRSDWIHYIESEAYRPHPFARIVPPGSQVYWHHDLRGAWIVMQRASYYTAGQGAGGLFNRGTALELKQREETLALIETQEITCRMMNELNSNNDCTLGDDILHEVCARAEGLDYIVLTSRFASPPVAAWTHANANGASTRYHLYSCAAGKQEQGKGTKWTRLP